MSRAAWAVTLLAAAAAAQEAAFVQVTSPKREYFVHEPIPLRLRVGFDAEVFRRHAVPLFQQEMDVPVQVRAPWLRGLEGARALPEDPPADEGPRLRFALDDAVVQAVGRPETHRGRTWTVLTVDRRYLALAPGDLVVPAPGLRYVHATRFRDDFLHGRRAEDPRDVLVEGEPLALRVLPPPEEGRPPEYVDAVGHFTMRADVDRRRLVPGQSFRLTLRIEGEGNLETLTPPGIREPGFHVYGTTDDRGRSVRTLVFEIAPVDGAKDVLPPIPLCYLDPGRPPAYRFARTDPIALDIERPAAEDPAAAEEEGSLGAVWIGVLAGAVAGFVAVLLLRRTRGGARVDPEEVRARAAAATFRAASQRPGADLVEAFVAYLAARLRCPPAAVVAPDLAPRLRGAGAPAGLAERAAAALRDHVEARYGGARPAADLGKIVGELETAFGAGEA